MTERTFKLNEALAKSIRMYIGTSIDETAKILHEHVSKLNSNNKRIIQLLEYLFNLPIEERDSAVISMLNTIPVKVTAKVYQEGRTYKDKIILVEKKEARTYNSFHKGIKPSKEKRILKPNPLNW